MRLVLSSMASACAVLLAIQCTLQRTLAAPLEDRVDVLPGFGIPPTPHYSGLLDATDGCDTSVNGAYCKIHYWLCTAEPDEDEGKSPESDNDPLFAEKPVVLWLNGGPGSSSILGLLQENGPLLFNATGDGLMVNPYAWTKYAHLVVIESPIGVGYSYCEAQVRGQVCRNTDKYTATASRAALVSFFAKFPELATRDFYITGESYAGVYIPTLAYEILLYNQHTATTSARINLQGLAVGDPCTDNTAQRDSMDALWYGYKYGLVDDAVFDALWNRCNVRAPNKMMQHVMYNKKHKGSHRLENIAATRRKTKVLQTDGASDDGAYDDGYSTDDDANVSDECDLAVKKFLLSTSRGLSQSWRNMYIDDYSLFAPVTNAEDVAMQRYMNRNDVRQALHVDKVPINDWPYPTVGFEYTKEYDACNDNADPDTALSMIDFYRKVAPQLPGPVWIYNGDTDPCVSYEGTRTAVSRFGLAELDGGGYRPWFYNHSATTVKVLQEKAVMFGPDLLLYDTGIQFGGEVVNYEHGVAFLTVHGSGHMVPQFRPQAALHMLQKFLSRERDDNDADGQEQPIVLSPLFPTNATLTAMTHDEFLTAMDEWTELAKSAEYAA